MVQGHWNSKTRKRKEPGQVTERLVGSRWAVLMERIQMTKAGGGNAGVVQAWMHARDAQQGHLSVAARTEDRFLV